MRIALDLQGHQSLYLNHQGAIYELRVDAEGRQACQSFALEGSLDALRDFFDAGRELIDQCIEQGGKTDLPIVEIGPPASE
jgi:hypothetical protein